MPIPLDSMVRRCAILGWSCIATFPKKRSLLGEQRVRKPLKRHLSLSRFLSGMMRL